jgi:capsule biosynthesis phosphatase
MKYIILCDNYSLQFIQCKHIIEYIIESIPSNEIFVIYNIFLDEHNFQEILINKCKSKKIHFAMIDYQTRGNVEDAFVGINKFVNDDPNDNIVFIDSNNIHTIANNIPIFENEFIGYSIDYNTNPNYSYIKFENNKITDIEEKKISDFYCNYFYGFKNTPSFLKYASMLLNNEETTKFNFSNLYNLILKSGNKIEPFFIDETKNIKNITNTININKERLRICFDLDNTLVSYPTVAGDYSTVKPINRNVMLLRKLKSDGHEIIIYTARRMKTHNGNIGKVIKDIARITIDTLEKLNIEYDELIFGKPIADIYIDDRAINPNINTNNIAYFGIYYLDPCTKFIQNKIKNNKYNYIEKCDEYIIKRGPIDILKGELFYYQNIPREFENYFPKLHNYSDQGKLFIELKIDYIEGIPLYYLYKNNLLTFKHIDKLFDILNTFHTYKNDKDKDTKDIIITQDNIKNNYINKLITRFNNQDYYFEGSNEILEDIIKGTETHFAPFISAMIHGDFWFSNIILTYDNNYKFIDMKGIIDNTLTLNGDIYYDYGKMYQSILGYDLILNNNAPNTEYIQSMKAYFLNKCHTKGLNINYLKYITKGLVFGTLPFIAHYDSDVKKNVWNFINSPLLNDIVF